MCNSIKIIKILTKQNENTHKGGTNTQTKWTTKTPQKGQWKLNKGDNKHKTKDTKSKQQKEKENETEGLPPKKKDGNPFINTHTMEDQGKIAKIFVRK